MADLAKSGGLPIHGENHKKWVPVTLEKPATSVVLPKDTEPVRRKIKAKNFGSFGRSITEQESNRSGEKTPVKRVLLSVIYGPQGKRRLETSDRPKFVKQIPGCPNVQDGDTGNHPCIATTRRVGNIAGFERCVLPHSDTPQSPEVSEIYLRRGSLPVCSHSVWPSDNPTPLHKIRSGNKRHGSQIIGAPTRLPGRLVSAGCVTHRRRKENTNAHGHNAQLGVYNKPQEVRTSPITGLRLRGLSVQLEYGSSVPYPRTDTENCESHNVSPSKFSYLSKKPLLHSGPTCGYGKVSASGPTPLPRPPMAVKKPLASSTTIKHTNSTVKESPRLSDMVVYPHEPNPGSSYAQVTSSSRGLHRCLYCGMGCSLFKQNGQRSMGEPPTGKTYKCLGDAGSKIGVESLFTNAKGEAGPDCDRQRHSAGTHRETGGDSFPGSAGPYLGPADLVTICGPDTVGPTHCRLQKRYCRRLIQAPPIPHDGMDSRPGSISVLDQQVIQPTDRPVCHFSKQEAPKIHFAAPRSEGMGSGCLVDVMGGDSSVRLSPNGPPRKGHTENLLRPSKSDCRGSVVASTTVVPVANRLVSEASRENPSTWAGSDPDLHRRASSLSGDTEFACLLPESRTKNHPHLSDEVERRIQAPQRESTRRVYEARLRALTDWAAEQQFNVENISVEQVLEFLNFQFQKGRAPSTIEGYRAAIADRFPKLNLTSDVRVGRLLKSFHRDRPRATRVTPPWDLQVVLTMLTEPPFEPLGLASPKFITWKTVFLLALASGNRRSELHAWMRNGVRFDSSKQQVAISACTSFLAKNQRASEAPKAFKPCIIPALSHKVDKGLPDRSLCPVRALKYYIDSSDKYRKNQEKLFISYKSGYGQEIKAPTISAWLKAVIIFAYKNLKPDKATLLKVKPHQVRAMAASWALRGGVGVEDIMATCHWKNPSTFSSFYLQPLAWSDGDHYSIGPFVAAQAVVHGDNT